jgi:hypothetical protein
MTIPLKKAPKIDEAGERRSTLWKRSESPPINKSVTCHFRRQNKKTNHKKRKKTFKQRKSRFPKALALQVLACACGSRKFFRIFKRSVFRPTLPFFLVLCFRLRKKKEIWKFTWFPISSSLWSCVPARQKRKNKQAHKQTRHKQILSFYFFSH